MKTTKDRILEEFPNLTDRQLEKLTEAFFTLSWVNPTITIDYFLIILSKDFEHFNL